MVRLRATCGDWLKFGHVLGGFLGGRPLGARFMPRRLLRGILFGRAYFFWWLNATNPHRVSPAFVTNSVGRSSARSR
jgi:hypothetical protein